MAGDVVGRTGLTKKVAPLGAGGRHVRSQMFRGQRGKPIPPPKACRASILV